jgi:hypothetical protein
LPRNLQEAKDDRLLIPAVQAARNIGITRRTLRNRINAGLVRSVRVGPRVYIPKAEIERIVNGEPAQTKRQPHNENSSSGKNREEHGKCEHFQTAKSPKERLDEILYVCADYISDQS